MVLLSMLYQIRVNEIQTILEYPVVILIRKDYLNTNSEMFSIKQNNRTCQNIVELIVIIIQCNLDHQSTVCSVWTKLNRHVLTVTLHFSLQSYWEIVLFPSKRFKTDGVMGPILKSSNIKVGRLIPYLKGICTLIVLRLKHPKCLIHIYRLPHNARSVGCYSLFHSTLSTRG